MTAAPARPAPPPPRSAPPAATANTPPRVAPKLTITDGAFEPPAIVFNAVEGFGKTSMLAHAPNPAVLMARGERGYLTLLGAGRVPKIPNATIESWLDLLAMIDDLTANPQDIKTLGLDALGGFERLCHEHVCNRDFGGDFGEKGFGSFQKGYEVSVTDWLQLLARLDKLRQKQGTTIVILSHCKVRPFKNPLGADFDRYVSDVHDKTWAATAKWADAVLFGNYFTVVSQKGAADVNKKGKGIGGTERVVYTERRDAFDAKNRYGMPESIDIANDSTATWSTIWQHIQPK